MAQPLTVISIEAVHQFFELTKVVSIQNWLYCVSSQNLYYCISSQNLFLK